MSLIRERKLETAALVIIAAMFIAMLWSGLSREAADLQEEASENEKQSSVCSRLDVTVVDRSSNETHTTVFYSSNIDVDILEVRFSTANMTAVRNVTDVRRSELMESSAPVPDADVSIAYPDCRTGG